MYWLIVHLLRPYVLLLLFAWLALFYVGRKQREKRGRLWLVALPLLVLTVMSLPAVAHLAQGTLEWQYPPAGQPPDDADVIVVLAGAVLPSDDSRSKPLPAPDSMYRCLHAFKLYDRNRVPILVSGGKVYDESPGPPVAVVMADFLELLGVRKEDLIVEKQSRTTYENVVEAGKLLGQRQARRIVLVTHAKHMPRAERCFRKQGFAVTPSACAYAAPYEWGLDNFLPDLGAAATCQQVFHEWLGMLWYWLNGRI